jgi:hypothetical protein
MTELQIGLIGLGALAVFSVLAYNRWQESRHRRLAEEVLAASHSDVLLDGEEGQDGEYGDSDDYEYDDIPPMPEDAALRREPVLADLAHDAGERIEPVFGEHRHEEIAEHAAVEDAASEADISPATTLTPPPVPRPPARDPATKAARPVAAARPEVVVTTPPAALLSPLVDYIIALETVEPITAAHFMRTEKVALLHVTKRLTWIGFDEHLGEWLRMEEESANEYRRVRVGVQLADRRGPLSDGELSAFQLAMQRVADEFMAFTEIPQRQAALDAAQELDGFCAGVDNQVGVNVVAKNSLLSGTKIRALAEAAGMLLEPDGVFVRRDEQGLALYTLANQSGAPFIAEEMKTLTTPGLTFLLDVPRVANGERVFQQMVELARQFASSLDGAVVDDNRRPLTDPLLESIRRQIGNFQASMASHGIPAGGPLALRLFS